MASEFPPPHAPHTSLDTTMGTLYLATLCSMGLWGAGTIQTYFYYNSYPKDSLWLKIYIFIAWLLDSLHQSLLIGMVYRYLITGFGDQARLLQLDKLLVYSILVAGFICVMVQAIFMMRIWKLSEKKVLLTGTVGSLVAAQFIATCVYFGRAVQFEAFAQLQGIMTITRIVNGVTAGADSAIALCLVVLLHRTRTGFEQTQTMINRLIVLTINTGLATSLCAILALVMGFVLYDTLLFMFFYVLISRLYLNSLLASLNSRNSLRNTILEAPSSIVMSSVSTDLFGTVTRETNFDDCGPSQLVSPRRHWQVNAPSAEVSIAIEGVVDTPMVEVSRYSYRLEGSEGDTSRESTSTKVEAPRLPD